MDMDLSLLCITEKILPNLTMSNKAEIFLETRTAYPLQHPECTPVVYFCLLVCLFCFALFFVFCCCFVFLFYFGCFFMWCPFCYFFFSFCVVFIGFACLVLCLVSNVALSLECTIMIAPSVFSNVY